MSGERNKFSLLRLFSALLCLFSAVAASAVPQSFVIESAIRTIDLTASPSVVRIYTSLIAKNIASGKTSDVYLAVDASLYKNGNLSLITLEQKVNEKKVPLDLQHQALDKQRNVLYLKATLAAPVAKEGTTTFTVSEVYSNAVVPFPREQVQTKSQSVQYNGNAYYLSPYKIDTLKTTVKVKVNNLHGATPFDAKTSDKLTYGPYKDVQPLTIGKLSLHWMDNRPILAVESLHRHLEVSHWGNNLWVQEDFKLLHNGARLKGHFSRVDYQFTARSHHQTNVLKDLRFILPKGASEVYFKDQIGNVSTSHFRNERTRSILDIKPRYPIYGGWQYTWFHGYYVPLNEYLKYDRKEGKYVLQVPFASGLPDFPIHKAVVRIVLPEGASDVNVVSPFKMDKEEHVTHFTYFDSIGRPTVILEKNHAVEENFVPITVTYKYSTASLFIKPIIVSIIIFGLFVLSMIYTRVDLSISTDVVSERNVLLRSHRTTVLEIASKVNTIFRHLDEAFAEFKAKRQADVFKTKRAELEQQIGVQLKALGELEKSVEVTKESVANASLKLKEQYQSERVFVKGVKEIIRLINQKLAKQKSLQNEVVTFTTEMGDNVDEKKKSALVAAIDKGEVELADLEKSLRKAIGDMQI
ncbi:proteasome regulatory particle base subunit [Nowakowskiella sp. JEL0407]|nr:proteasome regulatory particle base subunit [Nowakowskiella sp. JEL0407]